MDPVQNTQPIQPVPPVQSAPPVQPVVQQPTNPVATPSSPKSNKKLIWLVLVGVLLIIGVGVGWMIISQNTQSKFVDMPLNTAPLNQASPIPSEAASGSEELQVESVTIDDPTSDIKDIEIDASSL